MFEIPNSKRVRREDLNASASSASSARTTPDEDLTALFQARFKSEYQIEAPDFNGRPQSPQNNGSDQDKGRRNEETTAPEDNNAEEVEFRLFAARPANKTAEPTEPISTPAVPTTKIRLESPEVEQGEGGFIGPGRPDTYYLAGIPNEEEMAKLQSAVLSGEQVKKRASDTKLWEGCRLPWKVTIATSAVKDATGAPDTRAIVTPSIERGKKRVRMGKKGRIALRKKLRARKEKDDERKKSAEDKEREEKEKRNRKNREKKIKRREKERAKKAAQKSAIEGDVSSDE